MSDDNSEFVRKAMEYDKLKAELQTERTARETAESTLKEKDAEIWQLKMELAESKDSHTAKQRLRLCDKINKLESQLQAQAEVIDRLPHRWACRINKQLLDKKIPSENECDCGRYEALALPLPSSSKRFEAMRKAVKQMASCNQHNFQSCPCHVMAQEAETLTRLEAEGKDGS